ncbi:MAG: MBL fold metallo-hydrolase [Oscillospiraceae bacterium]
MTIHRLPPLSAFRTNSYLVTADDKNAVLIDAPANAEFILDELVRYGLTLKKILLTHGHHDHIGAAAQLSQKTGCAVLIHSADAVMLADSVANLGAVFGLETLAPVRNAREIADGDRIDEAGLEFRVLHTPGHTVGSVCYIAENALFSGDTLFAGTIGRTDFPGGSMAVIRKSLETLCALPGDYDVYPGHEDSTTLSYERATNFYLRF